MQAVLALNSGVNEAGIPNPETTRRIDAAMSFATAREIGTVIMVGGDADSMARYGAEGSSGITILAENRSKDTLEGAHFVKLDYLEPLGIDRVDIFTSDFHVPRVDWLHRRILGSDFSILTHSVACDLSPFKRGRVVAREAGQLAWCRKKLIGIGPQDDEKRQAVIDKYRFRDVDKPIARALVKLDRATNISRN